jgi:Methyltransferase domain
MGKIVPYMPCRTCGHGETQHVFNHLVLLRHEVGYYQCNRCGYLQTEEPFWLSEAYRESISATDTGIVSRSLNNAQRTSVIIHFLFNSQSSFLDFAGGYGLFTRIMRDIGFDFYSLDPHTSNIIAPGFSYNPREAKAIELVTAFEVFEHFLRPLKEIERIASISKNILFSTLTLPPHGLPPESWWYFGFDHGQHVGFYRRDTLQFLADYFELSYVPVAQDLHLFSSRRINPFVLRLLSKLSSRGLSYYVNRRQRSKTATDIERLQGSG